MTSAGGRRRRRIPSDDGSARVPAGWVAIAVAIALTAPTSQTHAQPALTITPPVCAPPDWSQAAFVAALRVEIATLAVDLGWSERGPTLGVVVDFACGGGAHATVTLERDGTSATHPIDLSDLTPEIRPRVLAIAVADAWSERAPEPIVSSTVPLVTTPPPEAPALEPSVSAPPPTLAVESDAPAAEPPTTSTTDSAESAAALSSPFASPTAPARFALRASFVGADLPATPMFVAGGSLELQGAIADLPLALFARVQGLALGAAAIVSRTQGMAFEGVLGALAFVDLGPLRFEGALGAAVGYARLDTTLNNDWMMLHRPPPPPAPPPYEVATVALDLAVSLRLTLLGPLGAVLSGGLHPYLRGLDGPDASRLALRDAIPWASAGLQLAF